MQTNPLTFYFGDRNPTINRLADFYGARLERMPAAQKLLTISVLAGVLYLFEASSVKECSIATYISALPQGLNAAIEDTLYDFLVALDNYEASTVATLVMVLGIYAAEEVR